MGLKKWVRNGQVFKNREQACWCRCIPQSQWCPERLCSLDRELTREGVSCFFDESRRSLPLGEKWPPRIFEAAEKCRVAVLLLSMDFIQSRWPMLELSAFLKAKESRKNPNLQILLLFYKISSGDLKKDILEWKRLEISEETQIEWKEALREVRKVNGLEFKEGEDEEVLRDKIIEGFRGLLPASPIVCHMPVESFGLAEGQQKVKEVLQLTSSDMPPMAVVIYGFGGIGKTTLAEAVLATVAPLLKPYRYTRVDFNIDSFKNNIKSMQEQILNDLFPLYTSETQTKLRNCSDGRAALTEAIKREGNKSIFLFVDNALRKQDLEELLPRDMKGLPKGSRILVTTRDLGATDMFIEVEAGLERQQYLVQPLSDQEAKNFLLKGCADRQLENIQEDVEKILEISKGVPLVLKIVRGHFRKQGYRADKCGQILGALKRGEQVKRDDLEQHPY